MSTIIKDSGKREQFSTGSVRDTAEDKGRYDLIPPEALKRLAVHYERGAKKYTERNWEKGQPFSRVFSSMLRHGQQALAGLEDEDHLAAVAWNAFALMTYQERFKTGQLSNTLNDIPPSKKQITDFLLREVDGIVRDHDARQEWLNDIASHRQEKGVGPEEKPFELCDLVRATKEQAVGESVWSDVAKKRFDMDREKYMRENSIFPQAQREIALAEPKIYKRKPLVYVAGKYRDSRGEWFVHQNVELAKRASYELWKAGLSVICPHANTFGMGGKDVSGDDFIAGDLIQVERSDAVVMLPNWKDSEGAKQEYQKAIAECKKIFFLHENEEFWVIEAPKIYSKLAKTPI